MRIDFDRICKLAGVQKDSTQPLNEASRGTWAEDPALAPEKDTQYGKGAVINETEAGRSDEGDYSMEEDGHGEEASSDDQPGAESQLAEDNEMVEVDIKELMEEIRRAKKMIAAKRNKSINESNNSKRKIQEAHLKRIIQQEVENMLSEIEEKDGSWVYGAKKPKLSKQGHVAQGATLPGIGFHKN